MREEGEDGGVEGHVVVAHELDHLDVCEHVHWCATVCTDVRLCALVCERARTSGFFHHLSHSGV